MKNFISVASTACIAVSLQVEGSKHRSRSNKKSSYMAQQMPEMSDRLVRWMSESDPDLWNANTSSKKMYKRSKEFKKYEKRRRSMSPKKYAKYYQPYYNFNRGSGRREEPQPSYVEPEAPSVPDISDLLYPEVSNGEGNVPDITDLLYPERFNSESRPDISDLLYPECPTGGQSCSNCCDLNCCDTDCGQSYKVIDKCDIPGYGKYL